MNPRMQLSLLRQMSLRFTGYQQSVEVFRSPKKLGIFRQQFGLEDVGALIFATTGVVISSIAVKNMIAEKKKKC